MAAKSTAFALIGGRYHMRSFHLVLPRFLRPCYASESIICWMARRVKQNVLLVYSLPSVLKIGAAS